MQADLQRVLSCKSLEQLQNVNNTMTTTIMMMTMIKTMTIAMRRMYIIILKIIIQKRLAAKALKLNVDIRYKER